MNFENKITLSELTFLIPFRIDSTSRLGNLNIVLTFLTSYFDVSILILEANDSSSVDSIITHRNIHYLYVYDTTKMFLHTVYNNILVRESKTKYIAIYDCDVLLDTVQIENALSQLKSNIVDFLLPHDGTCFNVDDFTKSLLKADCNVATLKSNSPYYYLITRNCFGGCLFANRSSFIAAGMDNEHFGGWGHEDVERIKRFEKLLYRIGYGKGPIYHLPHLRESSNFFDEKEALKSFDIYFNTCRATPAELQRYLTEK